MPAIRPLVGVCLALACAPAALAATAAAPDTVRATVPDLTVTATPFVWSGGRVPDAWLAERTDGNLGEALEQLPGLAMVRRAPSGTEPVIRGLGQERVRTLMGAVPLYGACPGHMDPPVTYLSTLSAPSFSVTREAGVEAGAGGIAGAITADPDYERRPGSPAGWRPFLEAGWESARDGWRAAGGVEGGTDRLDVRATAGWRRLDDYTAPDGRLVPAGLKEGAANLSAGWRPADGRRLWGAVNYVKEKDIVYTALPMDNRDTDLWIGNAGWRQESDGALTKLEVTGGFSSIDHLMDNRDKPNYRTMQARTRGQTDTWAGRARADLDAAGLDLRLGADVTQVLQDALRSRTMTATGLTAWDHMWPDARQATYGGLAEARRELTPDLRLNLSGRLDAYDSKARAADDAGLGGLTVREQYVRWYGAAAAETDRTETAGQAALRLDAGRGTGLAWHVRSGLAARPAGIGERYLAFAPAPGGYLVGNPTLKAEKAWQSEIGLVVARGKATVAVTAFHDRVTDYVLPTVIARQDVDGDGNDDVIKGYVNRDARLVGAELDADVHPHGRVQVPVSLAWVLGRNTTDGRDLPEIPAFGGRAEVRWLAVRKGDWWLRAGTRFAADQPKIDPLFGENRTPGWAVWHVGVEARPTARLTLRVLVDNLFDRLYWDHLTREAVLPVGGLAAGDEVPMPGRNVTASARWDF